MSVNCKLRMSIKCIDCSFWAVNKDNKEQHLKVIYFNDKLLLSSLSKYLSKSDTFHVKLYLSNEGFKWKIPRITRLTKLCCPIWRRPSIVKNYDQADRAVLSPLYPMPAWKRLAKYSNTKFTDDAMEPTCFSVQKRIHFWI